METQNNIKFNYKYRDAGNYKVFGYLVFANPDGLSLEFVEKKLRASLIDSELFYPRDWKLPYLKFNEWIADLDHSWNEYECVEYTSEGQTEKYSISEFLELIGNVSHHGHH